AHMITHFEDLTRAHEAVLKARAQIECLTPIIDDCDSHTALSANVDGLKACREALRAFFALHKSKLLGGRISSLQNELERLGERLDGLKGQQRHWQMQQDAVKQAILANGGDRIAHLGREIEGKAEIKQERMQRADAYSRLAQQVGLSRPHDADAFLASQRR